MINQSSIPIRPVRLIYTTTYLLGYRSMYRRLAGLVSYTDPLFRRKCTAFYKLYTAISFFVIFDTRAAEGEGLRRVTPV